MPTSSSSSRSPSNPVALIKSRPFGRWVIGNANIDHEAALAVIKEELAAEEIFVRELERGIGVSSGSPGG